MKYLPILLLFMSGCTTHTHNYNVVHDTMYIQTIEHYVSSGSHDLWNTETEVDTTVWKFKLSDDNDSVGSFSRTYSPVIFTSNDNGETWLPYRCCYCPHGINHKH